MEEDYRLVQRELLKSIKDLCMGQIMSRNPNKVSPLHPALPYPALPCPTLPVSARLVPFLRQDQPTLQALLDSTLSSGFIYEEDWKDMVRGGGGGAVPHNKIKIVAEQ